MDKRLKVNFVPFSNFGDTFVPYMLKKLEIPFIFAHHTVNKKITMIGSILGVAGLKDTIVWGSGVVHNKMLPREGCKYLAVRGPRTLNILENMGEDMSNVVIGDPAMLIPKIYNPNVEKKYKLGIIPHMVDYDFVREHMRNNPDKFKNTILIDPNTNTRMIEQFIDKVKQCEKIVGTCLHGIICAHSFGIPAKWMRVSDKLAGDDIKFYDHFESVGINDLEPIGLIEDENIEIPEFNSTLDIEKIWECRPWINVSEEYYVDIDKEGWEKECYPNNYDGRIVDDTWWK